MGRRPPRSTPFPYTTLFRSKPSSGTPPSGSGAPSPAPPQNSVSPQAESDRSTANTKKRSPQPPPATEPSPPWRSEEHTSELQSRPHLVCRLLLEKKK